MHQYCSSGDRRLKQLRPYQLEAISFLKANPLSGLFIDMGLGKTAAVLHAIVDLPDRPVLLVGPIRVIENVWAAEAKIWPATRGLVFSLIRGSPAARSRALATKADVYLVNPELLDEALAARSYEWLIIDESSMFKNPSTKRFKGLRKQLTKFKRRVILTGTPTPNSLEELWSQIFLLDRGERLGTAFYQFKSRYFRQVDYMGYKFAPIDGAQDRITKLISDVIFRVDSSHLPPREVIRNPVIVTLPVKARQLYDRMAKDAFVQLVDANVSAASAAAVLMKLRQVANGFVYDDDHTTVFVHDEKVKATGEILDATGSPVIVVYNFQHELAALKKAFPQGVTLDKGWNQDDWDRGKIPLLFLHPASGGHGLNLQYGSHTMVIFSASFSCEQMTQTQARIDRQGQGFPVVFHFLQSRNTVDELIMEVLRAKLTTQATVLSLIKEYANARNRRNGYTHS